MLTRTIAAWQNRFATRRKTRRYLSTNGKPAICLAALPTKSTEQLMLRSGVPESVFDEMRALYEEISLLTDSLADGDFELAAATTWSSNSTRGTLRVLHTPGHTPGSCSFVREADRTLICGDCVLKRITPNPILSPDPVDPSKRFPSLAEYLVSLARLRSYSPTLAYGGHGEPVTDFEEIFHRYVRAIDERQKKVVSLVPANGVDRISRLRRSFSRIRSTPTFIASWRSPRRSLISTTLSREGKIGVETRRRR